MLASPPNSVTPVMAPREPVPYSRTNAANAASYSPMPMPRPSSAQASVRVHGACAAASSTSPKTNTALLATSTGLPPWRSIARPTQGPTSADRISAMENAANTVGVATPRLLAMGAARIAGR